MGFWQFLGSVSLLDESLRVVDVELVSPRFEWSLELVSLFVVDELARRVVVGLVVGLVVELVVGVVFEPGVRVLWVPGALVVVSLFVVPSVRTRGCVVLAGGP